MDLIICNLNSKLNAAVEKNDASTALLRRMDQHQKQIKAQIAELKAETKWLEEEKETAIRKNMITPPIKKGLRKTFGVIWKRNTPIKNKTT